MEKALAREAGALFRVSRSTRRRAFDAVTAFAVMFIERLARSIPDAPAHTVVHMDEIKVPAVHMSKPNHRRQRASRSTRPASPDSSPGRGSRCREPKNSGTATCCYFCWSKISELGETTA